MPRRVSGLQWVSGLQPANGRLDGEAIGNEPVAIELLERRFANRAAILTPVARSGDQLKAPESGPAAWTRDVVLLHQATPEQHRRYFVTQTARRNYGHGRRAADHS